MGINVGSVEDSVQNAIQTAIDIIITTNIELLVRSINASSGQDTASVTANSERGNVMGILPLLKTHPKARTDFMN